MRSKFGTTKIEIIKQTYPNVKKVKQNSKGRYFYFRGTKTQNKKHLKSISHLIKTYPKRNYTK